ncbi:hypothetical protein C9439_03615 [archaeon SCG-AAA382B04]|nr:hypothetical protein C9439_03615 [archaeon SCG-AAA382B04]
MFSNLKLKLSMMGSLAAIIAITTLAATVVLSMAGASLTWVFVFIVPFFALQWYLGPKLVEKGYKVEEAGEDEYPRYHELVEELAEKSGIEKPSVMVADVEMPNAFAYGNYFTGDKVAVTKGLLKQLEWEEVEAVVGHELGHIAHDDSSYMVFLSILPAIFMIVGRMFFWSSLFGGGGDDEGQLPMIAIAAASMLIYFVLQMTIMHFSRMREYYADRHSSEVVEEGDRKLAEGLAKINESMSDLKNQKKNKQKKGVSISRRGGRRPGSGSRGFGGVGAVGLSMKPLLISDPDTAGSGGGARSDMQLVEKYAGKELSFGDRVREFFSSHPNIKKRLEAMGF